MVRLALALLAAAMANSAFAQVNVPEECKPVATVMKNECTATTVMVCDGLTYEDSYQHGKRVERHVFGPNWDLREYSLAADAATMKFDVDSGPGLDLNLLWEEGLARADRSAMMNTRVIRNRKVQMEAEYTLDADEVTISGVPFRTGTIRREFVINPNNRALDAIWEFKMYVSKDRNLMIEGSSKVLRGGREISKDSTPYAIAFPGDEGFLATQSTQGCGG